MLSESLLHAWNVAKMRELRLCKRVELSQATVGAFAEAHRQQDTAWERFVTVALWEGTPK